MAAARETVKPDPCEETLQEVADPEVPATSASFEGTAEQQHQLVTESLAPEASAPAVVPAVS